MKFSANFFIITLCFIFPIISFAETTESVVKTEENKNQATGSLLVEANIPKAEVYLDGIYRGLTPVTIDSVKPGIRHLSVKKNGYYRKSYAIEVEKGKLTKIYVDLELITGVLLVTGAPDNMQVIIGSETYTQDRIRLPEGSYKVKIQAFGYVEKIKNVTIYRFQETTLDGTLKVADFSASNFHPVKKAFNPENPAGLGRADIRFTVTAPGNGTLSITDTGNTIVRTIKTKNFTTWDQILYWDGKNEMGESLPDGEYLLHLDTTGADEKTTQLDSTIRIDRSIVYPFTESSFGIGTIGPVVSGMLMPKSGTVLLADISYDMEGLSTGFSIMAGLSDILEAGGRIGATINTDTDADDTNADVSVGFKVGNAWGSNLYPALSLHYSAVFPATTNFDSFFSRGLAFGPSLEFHTGHLSTGGSAEVFVGDSRGLFENPSCSASLGLSMRYTGDIVTASLWGNLNTGAFATISTTGENEDDTGFKLAKYLRTGISVQMLIPATNLLISTRAGYRLTDLNQSDFFIGGGFGILF